MIGIPLVRIKGLGMSSLKSYPAVNWRKFTPILLNRFGSFNVF